MADVLQGSICFVVGTQAAGLVLGFGIEGMNVEPESHAVAAVGRAGPKSPRAAIGVGFDSPFDQIAVVFVLTVSASDPRRRQRWTERIGAGRRLVDSGHVGPLKSPDVTLLPGVKCDHSFRGVKAGKGSRRGPEGAILGWRWRLVRLNRERAKTRKIANRDSAFLSRFRDLHLHF